MEGVALVYLNNDKMVRDVKWWSVFNSYLSKYNKLDASNTHDHMMNTYHNLMDEYTKKSNDSTVWDGEYGLKTNLDVH